MTDNPQTLFDLDLRIRKEIPAQFLLDPPDGGDVKTWEGVERLRKAWEQSKGKFYYEMEYEEPADFKKALKEVGHIGQELGRTQAKLDKAISLLGDARSLLDAFTDPRSSVNSSARGQALATIRDIKHFLIEHK